MATWRSSCPLEGRCSECGLDLAWKYVLNPRLRGPAWSIEHWLEGDGRLGLLKRMLRTWLVTYVPRRLWRSLAMHHRVRWRMLFCASAFGVLLSYVAISPIAIGIRSLLMIWYRSARGWGPTFWRSPQAAALWPMAEAWQRLWWPLWIDLAWLAAWAALMPLCFVIFRRTLRASRVRAAHIVRITLYGAMTWPLVLMLHSLLIVDLGYMAEDLWWQSSRVARLMHLPAWSSAAAKVAGAALIALWQGVFWWMAIKHYLKLRHAFLTALAITVISMLASIIVTGIGEPAWAIVCDFLGIRLA